MNLWRYFLIYLLSPRPISENNKEIKNLNRDNEWYAVKNSFHLVFMSFVLKIFFTLLCEGLKDKWASLNHSLHQNDIKWLNICKPVVNFFTGHHFLKSILYEQSQIE